MTVMVLFLNSIHACNTPAEFLGGEGRGEMAGSLAKGFVGLGGWIW